MTSESQIRIQNRIEICLQKVSFIADIILLDLMKQNLWRLGFGDKLEAYEKCSKDNEKRENENHRGKLPICCTNRYTVLC